MLIFLGILLLLAFLWRLTVKAGLRKAGCTRTFSRPAVFEGEEGEMIETVYNDRLCIIPWLRVESYVSPYIQIGRQERAGGEDEAHYFSVFTLLPYQQIRRTHPVRFLHRGLYNLGNASLTAGDLFGITDFHRIQEQSAPVLVYPRLLEDGELPLPLSRILGELAQQQQLQQDPFSVRGIRPYVLGDPVRDIHWPATARAGELHVKVHDYSARRRLLVVLNSQCDDLQWGKGIPEQFEEPLEYGISLAASLTIRGLRSGLAVGFASNMPLVDTEEQAFLAPEDTGDEERLLSVFARLKLVCTEKFPNFLESLSACSDMDFLLLSLYDSDCIQEQITRLRSGGSRVILHVLEGGDQ